MRHKKFILTVTHIQIPSKILKMLILILTLLSLTPLAISSDITAAPEFRPALLRRQSSAATGPATSCNPWLEIESSCAAANSEFILFTAFASQGPCLCYSSSTWAPEIYDSALQTCLSYLSTASPGYYTSLEDSDLPRKPCLEVASIVRTDRGVTSSPGSEVASSPGSRVTSSAPSSDPYYSACLSFQAIETSCSAKVPGFTTLPISAEESCLCFTSGTYAPSIFDGYYASCLTYYSTAYPALYSSSLGGDAGVRSHCALFEPTGTAAASTAVQLTNVASIAMASSGGGVTSLGPGSTSTPLTTAAATKTASASGNNTVGRAGGVSISGLLLLGILVFTVIL